MKIIKLLIFAVSFAASLAMSSGYASPSTTPDGLPFTFQVWKEQTILESQNQMLRISSRIASLKAGKGPASKTKGAGSLPNKKVKKTADADPLIAAEKDLKRAQESLETANGLQMDDYINVYLPTLQDQPEALQKLSEILSKEDLAEIFRGLMRKESKADAQRNTAVLEGLNVTTRTKTP